MFKESNKISRLKMYKQSLQQLRNVLHQSSVFRSVFGMNCKTTILWSESAIFSVSGRTSPDRPNVKYLSLVVRKPAFCTCENKDADQLRGNREADQRLCFRYTDSTILILPKSEISCL